jgi:aspartyl-tRNA(Asn)/glutamyl-tRNA(Gln) amidotransferase subunit B
LPPLVITQEFVDDIKKTMPELPDAKKERYVKEFGISEYDARVLTLDADTCKFFEKLILKHEPKICLTWLTVELLGRMNKENVDFDKLKISAESLSDLLDLIKNGEISGKIAKEVLDIMFETGDAPAKIIEEKGFKQVSDTGAIEKIIDLVIIGNPEKVAEFKSGKDRLFGFFVGQVMKESKGQANPNVVNEMLKNKLQ